MKRNDDQKGTSKIPIVKLTEEDIFTGQLKIKTT